MLVPKEPKRQQSSTRYEIRGDSRLKSVSSSVVRSIVPGNWRLPTLYERILLRYDVLSVIPRLRMNVLKRRWEVGFLPPWRRRNLLRFVKVGDALLPSIVEPCEKRSDEPRWDRQEWRLRGDGGSLGVEGDRFPTKREKADRVSTTRNGRVAESRVETFSCSHPPRSKPSHRG